MPQRLTGELRWLFSDRRGMGAQPFDAASTDAVVVTLFGGSDDPVGSLFNPAWQAQFPDGIALRRLHEEEDPQRAKDLMLGLDSNGAGFVISLSKAVDPS